MLYYDIIAIAIAIVLSYLLYLTCTITVSINSLVIPVTCNVYLSGNTSLHADNLLLILMHVWLNVHTVHYKIKLKSLCKTIAT